ncbi:MAG: T9SS type A sorting domain-containing protein [Bacteroidales bacterium]|nr:T9SS type A sorting domain-containing protein [Bacteroidales bacterium]
MKSTVLLLLFILLSQVLFPQQKGGVSSPAFDLTEQPKVISSEIKGVQVGVTKTYQLELFPGQVFNGWWYNWSNGGTISCVQKEYPEDVTWLSVTPKKFTSTGCDSIVPVKYYFVAPMTEGIYITTIADSLKNWDSVRVELTVTKSPKNCTIRKFGVNQDFLTYKNYLRYTPFNWADNICVQDYLPVDTLLYNFNINPGINWLTISPSSGKIFRNQKKDFQTTIQKKLSDSTWVLLERNYYSYPAFYHYFVRETEPKEYMLQFNGNNVISTGYYPGNSTKTLMYWVRFDEISNQAVGVHDGENHRFYLGIQNDNSLFAGMGNSYTPLTSLNLIPGKWYHMALTTSADSDSALVYINATEVSRFAYSFSGESKANLYIAARNDLTTWGYLIKGLIDEVQVWEKPLSRSEIIKYMFSPPEGNESGLAIYYPFNEGWGNFTKNSVDNYYNGILYYDPVWIDSIKRPNDPSIIITSVKENIQNAGKTLMLGCRPNPFNKSAEITFNLPENGKVILQLFDIRGTLVKTLLNTNMTYGVQTYSFNDATLREGMYFVKLAFTNSKGRFIKSIKIIRSDL